MADQEDFSTPPEETGEVTADYSADDVYEVRYVPGNQKPTASRRRGGLEFGRKRQYISTGDHPGVQTVDETALHLILKDGRLSTKKAAAPQVPDTDPTLKGVEALQAVGGAMGATKTAKKRGRPATKKK
jgi:hypothetical protein